MKTHLRDQGERGGVTYCGRSVFRVALINMNTVSVDQATCKRCQSVDDARVLAEYARERSAGLHPEDV